MDTNSNYTVVPCGGLVPLIAASTLVKLDNNRVLKIAKVHDDEAGTVDLLEGNKYVDVRDPETGERMKPTMDWLRELYRQGRLAFVGEPQNAADRQGRFALLDPDGCVDRDPRSRWRYSLASRAMADDVMLTDRDCRTWLEAEYGKGAGDLEFPKPSPSALRRWASKLKKNGKRVSVLVSAAGRQRGQSQLAPEINVLVHECALYYWSRPNLQKVDAYGHAPTSIACDMQSRPVPTITLS